MNQYRPTSLALVTVNARVIWLYIVCLWTVSTTTGELNLPLAAIARSAETFGQLLYDTCSAATALTDLRTDYLLMDPKVQPMDGKQLVFDMKIGIEKMVQKKISAVRKLVKLAESAFRQHNYQETLQISYPDSRQLNVTEFELVENKHFNNIPVNLSMSTVHVPTNIYDRSTPVLNGVAWSATLDEAFKKNFEDDSSLSWQYFASQSGFLRNFPGSVWKSNKPDIFDCRLQHWYIQAATSAKDIVVLLDTSGSMRGLSMDIARETVKKIVQTLNDDDYFNIIKFADKPSYLEPCLNGTLVQANPGNKQMFLRALEKISSSNIARHDLAIEEAFNLIKVMNETGHGSQCNRAIMILTDGAPSSDYSDMFAMYNLPNKEVRIFTYLIGRSRSWSSSEPMKTVACSNRGYFSHITSVADIHEHIQDYIHVMSRPVVINRARHTVWTNVYSDTAGLGLVLTVAQPAYDIRNSTHRKGILLGVVGTDIPLSHLESILSKHKLGVNAYAFVITNNGYTVLHPNLRLKESHVHNVQNRIDLSAVDYSSDVDQLRTKMVNRETGNMKMDVRIQYDNMKRLHLRSNHYYYTEITGTPFSLGIALPDEYGEAWIDGRRRLQDIDLSALRMEEGELVLAPWEYCRIDTEGDLGYIEHLIKYLSDVQGQFVTDYEKRCNEELIESLLFDAEATRGAVSSWIKENWDETAGYITSSRKSGIEIVFIGTRSGLTRYLAMPDSKVDNEFIRRHNSTIHEAYYTTAVNNGEEIFTFSLPADASKKDLHQLSVTASTPLVLTQDGREAVVAVVGLQMKYSKFYNLFMNITIPCSSSNSNDVLCHERCSSDIIDCYLLDYNGYVVLSEDPKELGKFFGELSGASMLMKELVADDTNRWQLKTGPSKYVFKRVQVKDQQGRCEIWSKLPSSSTSIFTRPISRLLTIATWLLRELTIYLASFSFFSTSEANNVPKASVDYVNVTTSYIEDATDAGGHTRSFQDYDFEGLMVELQRYMPPAQWQECRYNTAEMLRTRPPNEIWNWLEGQRRMYMPHVVGYRPCNRIYTYYVADTKRLPQHGGVLKCDDCTKSFSINHVARTNLMLLAVDSQCFCNSEPVMNVDPVEDHGNDTTVCQRLQENMYRKIVAKCYSYHHKEYRLTGVYLHAHNALKDFIPKNMQEDDPGECGRGSLVQSSIMFLAVHILFLICYFYVSCQ